MIFRATRIVLAAIENVITSAFTLLQIYADCFGIDKKENKT